MEKEQEISKADEKEISKIFGNDTKEENADSTEVKTDEKTDDKPSVDEVNESAEVSQENADDANSEMEQEVSEGNKGAADETIEGAEQEEPTTEQAPTNDLATGISIEKYVEAKLEGAMARCDVDPKKLGRAVRLIDPTLCMENGQFSEQKAMQEVEKLLTEWPEIKRPQLENAGNTFSFGAPSQEQKEENSLDSKLSKIFGNS